MESWFSAARAVTNPDEGEEGQETEKGSPSSDAAAPASAATDNSQSSSSSSPKGSHAVVVAVGLAGLSASSAGSFASSDGFDEVRAAEQRAERAQRAGAPSTEKKSAFAHSFREKLKINVSSAKNRRRQQLLKLSKITNSKLFKEQLAEYTKSPNVGDHRAMKALFEMLEQEMTVGIDELRFVKRLGEGGFAFVDLYERTISGTGDIVQYAVKVMKDKMMMPPLEAYGEPRIVPVPDAERIHFLTEAVLLKALRHKNVVGCYGCVKEPDGEDGSHPPPKLLQEFCPGGTLLDQLQRPRYTSEQALKWLREVALGMEYLHMSGGMHRDLKPENVMLKDNVAKVADFGLFRLDSNAVPPALDVHDSDNDSKRSAENWVEVGDSVHSAKHSDGSFNSHSGKRRFSLWSRSPQALPTSSALYAAGQPSSPRMGSPNPARRSLFGGNGRDGSPTRKSLFGASLEAMTQPVRTPGTGKRGRRRSISLKDLEVSTKGFTTKTGTERYMAPECYSWLDASDQSYTNKVDVFSFAIMTHELLTRKRAYEDLFMTMEHVAKSVRLHGLRPKLPARWSPALKSLMGRMWAKDPDERPSFGTIAEEIKGYLTEAEQTQADNPQMTVAKLLGLSEPGLGGGACCAVM